MSSAATVRRLIEQSLETRFPSALTPVSRSVVEVVPTGIDAVDRILEGGLPVGAISEIIGPVCSGRTSVALAFLAQRTAEGKICAWVDAHDALDPASAAASGINLKQLLWVRCRDKASDLEQGRQRRFRTESKPWTRLDQALRATDLLLQAGGFAAIVLDIGDTSPEHGCRIPLATWFRFRQAADRTRCSLVMLGKAAFAQSSAAVALECSPLQADTSGSTVLRGFTFSLRREKQRFTHGMAGAKKPPASTWSAAAPWETEKRA